MTFKILDDGLCYTKGIESVTEAKLEAESFINTFPFGELGKIEIVNETTGNVDFTFNPVINWRKLK